MKKSVSIVFCLLLGLPDLMAMPSAKKEAAKKPGAPVGVTHESKAPKKAESAESKEPAIEKIIAALEVQQAHFKNLYDELRDTILKYFEDGFALNDLTDHACLEKFQLKTFLDQSTIENFPRLKEQVVRVLRAYNYLSDRVILGYINGWMNNFILKQLLLLIAHSDKELERLYRLHVKIEKHLDDQNYADDDLSDLSSDLGDLDFD